MNRMIAAVPRWISEVLGGRIVRWAPPGQLVGDYDGRERTIEVFHVPAREQRQCLWMIRSIRARIEPLVGGPITVIFHTPGETERLYSDVGGVAKKYYRLAAQVAAWKGASNPGGPSYDPDRIEAFNLEAA